MYYDELLEQLEEGIQPLLGQGKVVTAIPALADVSIKQFGIAVATVDGSESFIGDANKPFSIQSLSKVFLLTLALQLIGDEIWKKAGKQGSDEAFNSIVSLENDKGIPRNPFVNAGALIVADALLSSSSAPYDKMLQLAKQVSGNKQITFNPAVAESERATCDRNAALAHFMKSFDVIKNNVADILDFYCHCCSLEMSCLDMAKATLYLANRGYCPVSEKQIISITQARRINSLLFTCGMYNASGEFAFRIGLPAKSGAGGGIFAIVPRALSICVWSPGLDENGNSLVGARALEMFVEKTDLSIF